MALLVGIDEAGFGPILGPLVVSASMFSVDRSLLDTDFWKLLEKSVANKRKHLAGRLLIADSKKVFKRSEGPKHLQRSILACLKYLKKEPRTAGELLRFLCPDCLERLADYPWYKQMEGRTLSANSTDLEIASSVLADDMSSCGVSLLDIKSCCLDVTHYNQMVTSTKNKASVLFTATTQLIQKAFGSCDCEELQVIIDRQGGRVCYRKNLQRMFSWMELKVLKETQTLSSYELTAGKRVMRLHFVVKADDKFLPVALSSMASKYIRELLVENINGYFTGHCSELKPTAGYWKDGLRFIKDLAEHVPELNYNRNQLIRCR